MDLHNGNTDSASDLEVPSDLYPLQTKSDYQGAGFDRRCGNQYISNVMPHNINNSDGSTTVIMEEETIKKPLISLEENQYVNFSVLRDEGRTQLQLNIEPVPSVSTQVQQTTTSNRLNSPATSMTADNQGWHNTQEQLTSPNNNTNVSPKSIQGSTRSSAVSNPVCSSEESPLLNGSKSAWQFCPQYGMAIENMDSSEDTPSPNSDASPESSGSRDSFGSHSDAVINLPKSSDVKDKSKGTRPTLHLLKSQSSDSPFGPRNASEPFNGFESEQCHSGHTNETVDATSKAGISHSTLLRNPTIDPRALSNLVLPSNPSSTRVPIHSVKLKTSASYSADLLGRVPAHESPSSTSSSSELNWPHRVTNNRNGHLPLKMKRSKSSHNALLHIPSSHGKSAVRQTPQGPVEAFVSLQDYAEPSVARDLFNCPNQGDNDSLVKVEPLQPAFQGLTEQFSCWQRASDSQSRSRAQRRPVSFHGIDDHHKYFTDQNIYENCGPGLDVSSAAKSKNRSRETQTDFSSHFGLRQSSSCTAMQKHLNTPGDHSWGASPEVFKSSPKVNLGVSSLRSAYPVIRRQPRHIFPTSHTADNLNRVLNSLESSQSTPSFIGQCSNKLSGQPRMRVHRDTTSQETGWRFKRPVSDSGLFLKNSRFGTPITRSSAPSRVPEFLRQISEHTRRAAFPKKNDRPTKEDTSQSSSKNVFERRLSDPSFSLPQPPKRSTSLSGSRLLARSLSLPSVKNSTLNTSTQKRGALTPLPNTINLDELLCNGRAEGVSEETIAGACLKPESQASLPITSSSLPSEVSEPVYENAMSVAQRRPCVPPRRSIQRCADGQRSEVYKNLPRHCRESPVTESSLLYQNLPYKPPRPSRTNVPFVDTRRQSPEPPYVNLSPNVSQEPSLIEENRGDEFSQDYSSDSFDSSSSDSQLEDRPRVQESDSSDMDTDSDSDHSCHHDLGGNFDESSEDSSDTISVDDLLTQLGVITQDEDADDEDGFQDSSDEVEEDELLLPVTAPTRMCDRPPSPYPGMGFSSDDDNPLSISSMYIARRRPSRDAADTDGRQTSLRRQNMPVRSQTEPDFMDFEILNPADYGIEHPPSYTDLFPIGRPHLPEMPPSYDDAIRPISVHQDRFDYANIQDYRINNRLSLQIPWTPQGDEYNTNPPPAYDEAIFNASGRSHDELSFHSQETESPIRRSRGRRILNGLRRFARKIFR